MGDLLVIMAQFTLKITLGNDAMQTGYNVASTLNNLSKLLYSDYEFKLLASHKEIHNIHDINGNVVGSWRVK
jgi:hypothetical protein